MAPRIAQRHQCADGRLDLVWPEHVETVQAPAHVPQNIGISRCGNGPSVVGFECLLDLLRFVAEVEDESVGFELVNSVQAREGLNGSQAHEHLVDVHRMKQGLVEPSLKLLGHDQHLVVGGAEALRRFRLAKLVHAWFGELTVVGDDLAREGNKGCDVRVTLLPEVAVDG